MRSPSARLVRSRNRHERKCTTEALYVPAAKVPGLTETRIELGVLPLVRFTDNQDAPEVETVKLIVLLLLFTDRVWDGASRSAPLKAEGERRGAYHESRSRIFSPCWTCAKTREAGENQ